MNNINRPSGIPPRPDAPKPPAPAAPPSASKPAAAVDLEKTIPVAALVDKGPSGGFGASAARPDTNRPGQVSSARPTTPSHARPSKIDSSDMLSLEPDEDEIAPKPVEISFNDDSMGVLGKTTGATTHEVVQGEDPNVNNRSSKIKSLNDDEIGDSVELMEDSDRARVTMNELLIDMMGRGGSDLLLSSGARPAMRVRGDVEQIPDFPVLTGDDIQDIVYGIMTSEQKAKYEDNWELDFAHNVPGYSRFRVNVLRQKKQVGAVLRAIPFEIKSVEELGLPNIVREFAYYPRGLVLVTGPTGSGKSTTLAAIVDLINRERKAHIVTIEDPVEFVHEHKNSIVNQREVNEDTKSFANALKHVLRQDPDVILIGEMRDIETIGTAITAAETGHLVFGTLHTQSAKETITRIVDVFPDGAKAQVRTQLSAGLRAVVCQTLLKKKGGGRVAALEIMIATDAIRNLVREDKLHQIEGSMETSKAGGMQTLEQHLLDLVAEGVVDPYDAADKAPNRDKFMHKLGGEEGIRKMEAKRNKSLSFGGLG